MIRFKLNDKELTFQGDSETSLLDYLRLTEKITSVKDGCSGQGVCGACTVEINGKPRLACTTKMRKLEACDVYTMEGIPEEVREPLIEKFVTKGAVQCGFCTPGMIMRVAHLFREKIKLSRKEIFKTISPNLCRCTGYIKIVDAIEAAMLNPAPQVKMPGAGIGSPYPKYQADETALGKRPFVNDMEFPGQTHAALRFSDHPRAIIKKIDISAAKAYPGVHAVYTAQDIPGNPITGLIFQDWPLMISIGKTCHYIGDVLAVVVADTEKTAREAASLIRVEYDIQEAITDMHQAILPGAPKVHQGQSNTLATCRINFGDTDQSIANAKFKYQSIFETQRIEHAFLETETALALPDGDGLKLYSQGQGVYVDRKQIAGLLDLPEEKVRVIQVSNGGGFGGKEDLTVQGHAGLAAYLSQKPVKLHLTREESIRMHPKRHPVWMDMSLACDENGKFTAIKLRALGDTGAYASVGDKVMERVVGHATGGYTIPNVDIEALTVYTNNIPSGAMRGFGVPQVIFALENCIDELCIQGDFDRWQIRYDNALVDGSKTATGQKLFGVGLRKTLLAVKDEFQQAKYAGIACG